jgi:hypothetical protein
LGGYASVAEAKGFGAEVHGIRQVVFEIDEHVRPDIDEADRTFPLPGGQFLSGYQAG